MPGQVKLRTLAVIQLLIVLLYFLGPESPPRMSIRVEGALVAGLPFVLIALISFSKQHSLLVSYTLGLASVLSPLALLGAFGVFFMPVTGEPLTVVLILTTPVLQLAMLSSAWSQFRNVRSDTTRVVAGIGAAAISVVFLLSFLSK